MANFEPLPSYKFLVELSLDNSSDKVDGVFLECQAFQRTQELIEICEVTSNKFGKATSGMPVRTKIPGNVKSGNIILRRCMSSSIRHLRKQPKFYYNYISDCDRQSAKIVNLYAKVGITDAFY